MSQNISNPAASNVSPTQNQMGMQNRMPQPQQLGQLPQQHNWSGSYYGQPNQSPYMNPYMPHGAAGGVSNHASAMSQPPLSSGSQKSAVNSSDRTRAAYPPQSNLYGQPLSASGAPGSYYGYDPYYNQVSSDPYLTHSNAPGAPHWSTPGSNNSMMGTNSNLPSGSLAPPLRPQTGPSSMLSQSQSAAGSLPPTVARPPPPSSTQAPERSSEHLMSSYDRQRGASMSQQSQHPSAILSQNMSSPSALSPNQHQMGLPNRVQPPSQLTSMSQQPGWSSSYYGQSNQSPYMSSYMSHGAPGSVPSHTPTIAQPPPNQMAKPPTNGSDRSTYPPHSSMYQPAPPSSSYYSYDQGYGQVPSDLYPHPASAGASSWPAPTPGGIMNSGPTTAPSMQSQLRPQSGSNLQPPSSNVALAPSGSRPTVPSQTPERSPSISASYPSPNQSSTSAKAGSNSLAQLEQMVMPGTAAPSTKSPNQRSTTSSPSTNAQPSTMQYSYNSGGQGGYFSPSTNQVQPGYYPSYESSDSAEPSKTSWSDTAPGPTLNALATGSNIDPSAPFGQSYEGASTYGDYTQLSTPSQTRFSVGSEVPIEQSQIDKSDPYAIDSQTFEDNDDQATATKTKKSRGKKGDDSNKKERRQRAPRASKAAATPKPQPSPSNNAPGQNRTPSQSKSHTPEVPQAVDETPDRVPSPKQQLPSVEDQDKSDTQGVSNEQQTSLDSSNNLPPTITSSIPSKTSMAPKSPAHPPATSSPTISGQPRMQYPYAAGPEGFSQPQGHTVANQAGYYPQYGTSASMEPQKSSWTEQNQPQLPNASPLSSAPYNGGAPAIDPQSPTSKGHGQYTQLSAPSQNQTVDDEVPKVEAHVAEDEPCAASESAQPVSTQKGKKSRPKKSEDSTKKERKPRPSRAQKAGSSKTPQPAASTTPPLNLDGQSQMTDEGTQPLHPPENVDESATVVEPVVGDENHDAEPAAKPKRIRPKKSSDRSKRPSRAAPKPTTTDSQSDQLTETLMDSEQQPELNASMISEPPEEGEVATSAETTPAKPKRIRIRDSSSKGKKKLPKFALKFAKTKKRKRLGSSDNEQSDMEKTPPPSPDECESGVQKRRSARNTKKLKYNDDIELGFSESDDDSPSQPKKKASTTNPESDSINETTVVEEPTVFAAPVEDTMVVEKIMSSRMGKRELEPEPGETLPLDGTFIDIEEFYVKYKNMSYLHCDWRTLEELERGDRRVAQKVKRFKQKKDSSSLFSFMDEELFDPQYCEVDRILAVNEVEEMVPVSDDENEPTKSTDTTTPKEENHVKSEATAETEPVTQIESKNVDLDETNSTHDLVVVKDESEMPMAIDAVKDQPQKSPVDASTNDPAQPESSPDQVVAIAVPEAVAEGEAKTIDQAQPEESGDAPKKDELSVVEPPRMKKKVSRHYLVKWRSLTYEDSTWELEEHLDSEKIKHFERFKDPPPKSKWKAVKRPKPEEWVRKEVSPVYKNNNTLREYQLEGINWLSFCWHQGRNCILADEMGLGKTIQSIAFINEIYEKGIYGPFLIIVPLSTVGNWAREFETWTNLNVITYHGGSTSREMLKEYEMFYRNEQGNRITQVYKFQVMITTFEIILSDCLDLMKIPWRCCIIDEAHRLKNRNCKLLEGLRLLNMEHRVLLTGTPLQNNVEELFSLLNFLEPTQFASTEQFLQEFGDLKTEAQVDKLKLILKPMMLRRLKEDVEKTLAPKEETIVEVELTNIQKKYYRAILERNFSFLQKGSTSNNMPNLMNTMMELRKCCIHPYLINGAEEQILYEARQTKLADGVSMSSHQAMINASGKLVLLDKLLPRLKADGHRVLIFSQMVRCLDILEDYVTHKQYPFERIDGRVRGSDRQQAIDRYSKPGSDRFVFLLCTRAGGLGINLTAADTVIIFDSDWNPQNDLQAQARCHRIGQSKAVKIYRLICRNTYEREMFDKASLKLGLDKAVLQSMNTQKAAGMDGSLTKKEIEELLRKGAYGALMDDDNAGDKFCEEDIDQILQRRTQVITIESAEAKGSTFSKATFSSSNNREDIELDDPDFWEKWAKKANIDPEDLLTKEELVQLAPRRRTQTKRYGADGNLIEMSDLESSEEDEETISMRTRGSRRGTSKPTPTSASKRGKRNKFLDDEEDELMANIDGGYWSKNDCLKIESGLLTYGWGRWEEIIANNRFRREITVDDCENICRVILLYCLNSYKGDEKIKSFIWELIVPPGEATSTDSEPNGNVSSRGRKPKTAPIVVKKSVAEEIMDAQWPKDAQNDPLIALPDDQYRRHLQRNCNRLLIRVKFLHYLKYEILKGYDEKILANCDASEVDIPPVPHDGEIPVFWWDDEADKSLLVGIFKHGHDNFNLIRQDPKLCFLPRCGPPTNLDLSTELNSKGVDYNEEDSKAYVNLKKTAAGACLHELLNNVARELREEANQADKSDDIIDENKNSILKCNDTGDSLDDMCENGVSESGQTMKMDITDDDSLLNESSVDGATPAVNGREPPSVTEGSDLLPFPSGNELNQRFRRLITTYQRLSKKLEIQLAQKVRDELKKERTSKFEAAKNEREERKRSQAQKWSRREESDFVKAISSFGVEYDPKHKRHDWNKFRLIGKLDKKMDETLEDYFKAFVIMCKRATSQPLTEDEDKNTMNIETIAQDRASRCLSRIEFFNKIRVNVMKHPQLDKRLLKCQSQSDLPDWWQNGVHDKDLLIAVAKHGLSRLDYNLAHDSELAFESLIREKVEHLFANPPTSILIPLEQLQELLDRNGVEYSKDIELEDDSEVIKATLAFLLDQVASEEADAITTRGKTTRSGLSRSSSRRGANTAVKSAESNTSLNCIRLTTFGDSRNFDRRVAEVTPVMPDKIPEDLRRTHEAGEVTVTIQSDSVMLKLDDKPPIVLLGASNPVPVKIRWPKDKAIQTRLEYLIYLIENNEWPNTSKQSVPTITLPSHMTTTTTTTTDTTPLKVPTPSLPTDETPEGPSVPESPSLDFGTPSRPSRQESRDTVNEVPETRGRRGRRGRRPKQAEPEVFPREIETPPKEDRRSPAKLRNLLSQGSSSPRTSTPEKPSKLATGDKQTPNLSSLLANLRNKKGETSGSSRTREEKRPEPVEQPPIPSSANLLPQILANMKPEFRDLLANPEAASLLMNSLSSFPGLGNLGASLRPPMSTPTSIPSDNIMSTSQSSSRGHRGDRSSSKSNVDKQNNAGLPSLLASFKQQKPSAPARRDGGSILDQALPGPSNLIPQLLANMKPEFRDLLANPDAASILMNSLGGITGATNFANLRPSGSDPSKPTLDSLLQPNRSSSSKGPPPAHQRSDNVPAAHGSTTRELRRNPQNARDSSSGAKSTRGKSTISDIDAQAIARLKNEDMSSRGSTSRRRGRPSSGATENAPAPGVDILDLSALQPSRKGSSLLRTESRSRRGRDQPEEALVSTRSSSGSRSTTGRGSSRHNTDEQDHHEQQNQLEAQSQRSSAGATAAPSEQETEKAGGRSTRASKRIGSRIDALALNLQAKRLNVSDSPESSPTPSREPTHENQMLAHGSKSSTSDRSKQQSSKAPPAAHSGSQKSSSSREHHRGRDKDKHASSSTSTSSHAVPSSSASNTTMPSASTRQLDPLAQFMAKVAPQTSSIAASLAGQSQVPSQSRQDPLAQLMSNPASLLAGLNPGALGAGGGAGGTNDLMNQLLRKAGSNDFVKNLLNEFVKNPSLASMDPNILATLTASMPMSSQSLPNFNLPTTASTSLPYGNFTNPLANPFLPFNMANLGLGNPLSNPLGMFPNLYMPTGFPQQQPQQQQQQPQTRQQPNQSSGSSDGGPRDKKMRYSRK